MRWWVWPWPQWFRQCLARRWASSKVFQTPARKCFPPSSQRSATPSRGSSSTLPVASQQKKPCRPFCLMGHMPFCLMGHRPFCPPLIRSTYWCTLVGCFGCSFAPLVDIDIFLFRRWQRHLGWCLWGVVWGGLLGWNLAIVRGPLGDTKIRATALDHFGRAGKERRPRWRFFWSSWGLDRALLHTRALCRAQPILNSECAHPGNSSTRHTHIFSSVYHLR